MSPGSQWPEVRMCDRSPGSQPGEAVSLVSLALQVPGPSCGTGSPQPHPEVPGQVRTARACTRAHRQGQGRTRDLPPGQTGLLPLRKVRERVTMLQGSPGGLASSRR